MSMYDKNHYNIVISLQLIKKKMILMKIFKSWHWWKGFRVKVESHGIWKAFNIAPANSRPFK